MTKVYLFPKKLRSLIQKFKDTYIYVSVLLAADVLHHLPIQENQKVILGSEIHSAIHARDFVARKLEAFKGFDGSGFFTLNKEFLSGVAANFLTYLIVLVQFKVGESSK